MVKNAESFAKTAGEACRNCHDDQFEMYKQSYHGKLSHRGRGRRRQGSALRRLPRRPRRQEGRQR